MELKIEQWPVERLLPYARNPRRNDSAVPKLAGMIKEFGFRVPVIARSDGSLIDGHLRLKAAQLLGMESVPVVLADDMSPAQEKAFRIAVNKAAELAEWDDEYLKLEIEELQGMDFDLGLTGFEPEDIEALGLPNASPLEDWPELPDGDKNGICTWTFTLTTEQKEAVSAAVAKAKGMYSFDGTGNENGNGNALAAICEAFNGNS